MFGGLAPRLKSLKLTDTTLLLTRANTSLAVNRANNFAWTGTNTWSTTSTFNGFAQFNGTVYLSSTTYSWSSFYSYGTFYTNFTPGSIPYIGTSNQLTYDQDDYWRDNGLRRYGMGIGYGDTLLAKHHIVGASTCTGTPTPCASFDSNQSGCEGQDGCAWQSYGSCSGFSDQTSCDAQRGCLWNTGSSCGGFMDQMSCQGQSPCTWDANYSNCTDFNGNQSSCESKMGECTWNANTCGSYGNATDCNNASPCSWSYQNCTDFNDNYGSCTSTSGCTWSAVSDCALLDGTDQATCEAVSGCTWDSGSNECRGTCSGDYGGSCTGDNSNCSGSYVSSYTCNGTYGAGCNENYVCNGSPTACSSYSSDSGTCAGQAGCVWDQEFALYADGGATILNKLTLTGLPTSSSGLTTGQCWNNGGVLTIV